jgi:DNA (cytosine-5)-methyltransferase 1
MNASLRTPILYSLNVPFTYIDLFAGIGGFHAALSALGGECAYAVEIDPQAAKIYQQNWGINPLGDITQDVTDEVVNVPPHDVLVAGFPCQPFSKSGAQRGMEETRGTLYWSILKIIQLHKPSLVLLENVRNLAGPRHVHEWKIIVDTLRSEGYMVCDTPAVFSPHLLPPDLGGCPQVRERVFILAIRNDADGANLLVDEPIVTNRAVGEWNPQSWNLFHHLPIDEDTADPACVLSESEILWIDAWDDFVRNMWELREGKRLPGFPLWADAWVSNSNLEIPAGTPSWKADFLIKNSRFYDEQKTFIDAWVEKWEIYSEKFPPSRRKLEWQAQDTPSLWETVMHFRPSGIRAKRPTYLPALVAITQTSIIGPLKRRLSPREAARLQGLPDWFAFDGQNAAATYRQLGNGVNVGVVWHVMREAANKFDKEITATAPHLLQSIKNAPFSLTDALDNLIAANPSLS